MRFLFENYSLDADLRELRRDQDLVPLEPQVFDLLVHLVRNRNHVVSKDEIFQAIWRGRLVSDSALTTRINAARAAVGDDGKTQRLIRTLRQSGFRFVGEVREQNAAGVAAIVPGEQGADFRPAAAGLAPVDRPSLAVMPFTNLSDSGGYDYFVDGIVEDITTALSKWRWFLVIDRNTAFTYKNRHSDARVVGEELGVRYLLGGSVRFIDRRLRISAQLVEASSGTQVWADRFESVVTDVFTMQDELSNAVVAAIEPKLRSAELRRIRHKRPESFGAYDFFLQALWRANALTESANTEALRLLAQCLDEDPAYAAAAALASFCHRMRRQQGWSSSPDEDARGMAFAERALGYDPDDPFVLWTAGHAITALGKEHARARRLIDRSLELNPNCAQAWTVSGWNHDHTGVRDAAFDAFERALRLSPFDPMNFYVFAGLSASHMNRREYEKAIEFGRKSIHEKSNCATAWRSLAVSLAYLGRRQEALAAVNRLREIDPGVSVAVVDKSRCNLADPAERQHYLDGLRIAGLPEA